MFWDLNPDKYFTVNEVTKQLTIESSDENMKLVTRKQKFKNDSKESCLDYIFSSNKTISIQSLDNFWSDHISIKFKLITTKTWKIKSTFVIKKLLVNKDWTKNPNMK